ncbi:glycoside hydrolase family 5 protein [Demequina lignilytica]|uniref:cellulase n=1 Tax=Demequina lignilytica TaxID=3051663 RepID=A0AB35MDV6_9MICO|nr:cellulase family glycosylhydrolase [Demequina sp. SYSU T0a273]MDN4481937.1 cellulase family glycosylhydrolase [Demequina sp. SYSU T0a273]
MSLPDPPARRTVSPHAVWPVVLGIGAVAFALAGPLAGGDPEPAPTGSTVASPTAAASPSPSATPPPDVLEGVELDPLQEERLDELRGFVSWLADNDASGYVGEVGWPTSDPGWEPLGRYWYLVAEQEGLWTTAWAAGSHWPDHYPLITYGDGGTGSLDTSSSQATVIEELQSTRDAASTAADARHGVNLAGLEFGTGTDFSSASPGELGVQYFAEPVASYAWLAGRGIDLVRLPIRWERLQPEPGSAFDQAQVAVVSAQLDAAAAAGIDVILDLHNYGSFASPSGVVTLGSDDLPGSLLADVWLRIADAWGDHPAVLGYGVMNEPHDLGGGDERGAAEAWEDMTQATVDALRSAGDSHLLLIAGYDWSSLARWSTTHPTGWIVDPAENFRYEAHHYWDAYGAGSYDLPYAEELASAYGD